MTTKLYNTEKQQIIHTTYGGYYTVDGKRPQLPPNVVELLVVNTQPPTYNETTQYVNSDWQVDLQTLQYIQSWTIQDKTQYEIAMEDWRHPQYQKRIIAPKELLFDDIGIKMFGWFQLNGLPVELVGDTYIYLWCNEILPEHQTIVDNLQGIIQIQDRPVEN
jgi:hypothetical protein